MGKQLSRRARSRCELCEVGGERLRVTEVHGCPDELPSEDWVLLLCDRCRTCMVDPSAQPNDTLRFLTTSMWSELQPVQVVAVRMLRALDIDWAREALESLWLDEAQEALIQG